MTTIEWKKYSANPLSTLAPDPDSWRTDGSMTVDILKRGDRYLIYYIGKTAGIDRIGVASCPVKEFDGASWTDYPNNPVLSPGKSGSYDSKKCCRSCFC